MTSEIKHPTGSPHINESVRRWIEECIALCQPAKVVYCNGSAGEKQDLIEEGLNEGIFIRLNPQKWPNCYLHRSNQNDVARSEHLTFICTPSEDMAGPTNKMAYKLRANSIGGPYFDTSGVQIAANGVGGAGAIPLYLYGEIQAQAPLSGSWGPSGSTTNYSDTVQVTINF